MIKRVLLWFVGMGMLLAVCGVGAGAMLLYWASRDLPNITRIADYTPAQATTVLARDGSVLGVLAHERRYVIKLEEMSRYLPMAFLAAEDDGFYSHHGVDPVAIVRAAVTNFLAKRTKSGASTITQQLIKQLLLSDERSYTRKMKEAILAYRLEKDLSKDDILSIYLNHIYLGEYAYGVEAAARNYFGKHASDITLAESAVIAGLPKAPSEYNPFRHPKAAKQRQMYVLGRLHKLKWITQEEYDQAVNEPLVYWSMPEGPGGASKWYLEETRRLLIEFFTPENLQALGIDTRMSGEDYVCEAGLVVRTAMDPEHQNAAGDALRKGLEEIDKRQGWRGPVEKLEADKLAAFAKQQKFSPIDLAEHAWVKAAVTKVDAAAAQVALGQGYVGTIPVANMGWARKPNSKVSGWGGTFVRKASDALAVGDVVWVSATGSRETVTNAKGKKETSVVPFDADKVKPGESVTLRLQQEPLVQGAIASVEPQSGDVVALIGGYQFGSNQFNRATQAKRQPGSSFKPVVYSTALDFGFTPSSIVLDAPFVYVNPYTNQVWRPSNFENNYKGELPLWQALALSRNTCTVRMAHQVGVENIITRAKALGLEPNFPRELSICLGAVEVTPLNMAQAYCAFANQGLGVRPRIITSIEDSEGRELYRQEPEHWQAITPQNAYIMDTLLKNVVNAGTGTRAKIEGRNIAGKTGTTNNERDTWFMGFSPYLTTAVYVGYDQQRSLGRGEQGGRTAAPIFRDYRMQVEELYPPADFVKPDGVVMNGVFAYRSDIPMQGASATDGTVDDGTIDTNAIQDGEDLMRQMF